MEQIEIQYTLDKETLKIAYWRMMKYAQKDANPWVMIGIWLVTLIIIQFMYPGLLVRGAIYAVLSLAAILGYIYFLKVYHPNKWLERIVKELELPKPVQMNISQSNFDIRTTIVQSTSKWEIFKKMLFTEDLVIGYFAHKQILVIPVSAFTPEQLAQFKTWAKANLKEVVG